MGVIPILSAEDLLERTIVRMVLSPCLRLSRRSHGAPGVILASCVYHCEYELFRLTPCSQDHRRRRFPTPLSSSSNRLHPSHVGSGLYLQEGTHSCDIHHIRWSTFATPFVDASIRKEGSRLYATSGEVNSLTNLSLVASLHER